MQTVPLYNSDGSPAEPISVDAARLGEKTRVSLMRNVAHMYESRQHLGFKGHLTRAGVRGSTKKLYRQKHTGMARAGQRGVVHRRGGGLAFLPKSGGFGYSMPKKALRTATSSALLSRLQDNELCLISELSIETPKTRVIADLLKKMDISGACLLVIDGPHEMVWKSARNIAGLEVRRVADVNAYDLLKPKRVIFTRQAFDWFMANRAVGQTEPAAAAPQNTGQNNE